MAIHPVIVLDVWLKKKNVNLVVALKEMLGSHRDKLVG